MPHRAMLHRVPTFSTADAERLARDHFGLRGTATPLASERDQNFLIDANTRRAVLKIANPEESRALLEAQQAALAHVAGTLDSTPRLLPAVGGDTLVTVCDTDGTPYLVWAMTHLTGRDMGTAPRRSSALYEDLGRRTGQLDAALADFDHPALHRAFAWDLASGGALVAAGRPLIGDEHLGAAIDRLMARFDEHTAPLLGRLPRQAIHGDLNDYNVLVGGGDANDVDPEARGQCVTGIVDFGDLLHSYRVADVAIAAAYAMLDAGEPLQVAAYLVRGFSGVQPLDDAELACLFGLAALRLCVSACIAAEQMRERPDLSYLGISQRAVRRTLPRLAAIPFAFAEATLRAAAGVAISPAADRVVRFLERRESFAPVVGVDLEREPCVVLDLSIGSPMLSGDHRENMEPVLTPKVFGLMRRAGVRVAVGQYDEPRLLYLTPLFAVGGTGAGADADGEQRTVHIGLDLFATIGTPVYAPFDGTVHGFADNRAALDYGPVIVLRHETDDGTAFFTLYGHLSRTSLDSLRVGQRVRAGEQIASLGGADVNGGWTPHLHLQIIIDLLGAGTDFPGVARAGERAVWRALCPDPNLLVRVPAERFPARPRTVDETLAERRARIGGNLSVAYRDPVKIVRGWAQYLYDDEGRRFIDAYNNVPHVGHCHPRVVEAAARQMRVLNTNTRYLNDLLDEYAGRLLATLPRELEVCYFVNSASEANELALRLARAYTGQRDMIVLEAAYHGNTTSLIDVSPYKHAGPGGAGAPDWVHVAPLPDDYRGAYRRGDADIGARYAEHVASLAHDVERRGRGLAGFIAETCPSVGGQLALPDGYLANAYRHVRAGGGVCIADEVQTGLGRMGTHFWAFEAHGVVPDMVVMGKPLGNGHPIGAVAVTRDIARAFDNGMEYFSTFGGNTVSCAVGLAVLDVLRDEQLQAHALQVGRVLLDGLAELQSEFPIVGDVRGSGLFLGAELVRDRETLEPAGAEASFVANRMRERGVLLGTDGPHHNVVKIRPPMPFDAGNAARLLAALRASLAEL
jgi:4-aminobutyrate aminotransferase-like enzyme/Ser/Thr protein kinase RdoA (MazF antagonist)